jgi:integrase
MSKKFPFTNRSIAALPAHDANSPSKQGEFSDSSSPGLRLLCGKNGVKRFAMRYSLPSGRTRYAPIGTFSSAFGVAEARAVAAEMRAILDRGGDPLETRDRFKSMPTFSEFVRQDYLPYAYKTKRSAHDDDSKFRLHLEPKFGHLRLCDITMRDVQMHHAAMRESHSAGTANRHLAVLSATFRKAVEWEKIDKNPATGIKAFRENNQTQRFLTSDEIQRLWAAMETDPNRTAVSALKLLLLTGTRREEALRARWEHVDLEAGQWWLPTTKSGRGRYIALSTDAVALLSAQPSKGTSTWVFPGRFGDRPLHDPRKTFGRLLATAGVAHLRIHDLRHSFASLAVNAGATLYEVQGLLGHSTAAMTQRYAHLADAGLRRASQAVADVVSAAVRGNEVAQPPI